MTNKTIRLLLTCHDRPKMASEAYASALSAGFRHDQITCCITGKTGMERLMKQWDAAGSRVATYIGRHANDAWLQELVGMGESHVVILHDDDLLHEAALQVLSERDDWDAAVWECRAFGGSSWQSDYWKAAEGVYDGELARQVALAGARPPSLVQACWPRQLLIDAFSGWKSKFSDCDIRVGMPIGNDLMAWHALGDLTRVLILHEPLSHVRHHQGSTTVRGIADGTIDALYAKVKTGLKFKPRKLLTVGHLFVGGQHEAFLQNIDDNPPAGALMWMAEQVVPGRPCRVIPDYTGVYSPTNHQADAACAFAEAVRLIHEGDWTDMLWIEHDCRFAGTGWDLKLWQEHLGNGDVRCSGSPVIWGTFGKGSASATAVIRYAGEYLRITGRAVAFEGSHEDQPAIYPNGALAIYRRELLWEVYGKGSQWLGLREHVLAGVQFDLQIGRLLASGGVASALQAVGWLRSSYSGCMDHQYTLEQRQQMLAGGDVVAIHQVKAVSKPVQDGCASQTPEDQRLKNQVL